MLSFGNLGPVSMDASAYSLGEPVRVYDDAILRRARASGATTYRPPSNTTRRAVPPAPTLSFPGVASVQPVGTGTTPLSYGKAPVSAGGFISSAADFLRSMSLGTPVGGDAVYDDAILRNARASGATTYNPNSPAALSNTPQTTTGAVDGTASWIERLRDAGDMVQGLIGSGGDASGVQRVAFEERPSAPNWLVVGGIVALAGAAYYVATR